jgi:cytochrome c-type biogenesis protein CcmH
MNATPLAGQVRPKLPVILVLFAVLTGVITLALVAMRGGDAHLSQAQQVQQIAAGLHCPICKDLSVADSPAPLAQQMREEIAQKLRAGESADQIRADFVAAYGDSVLMSPPRRGLSATAYFLPAIVIVVGVVIALMLVRRWVRRGEDGPTDDEAPSPLSASQRRAVQKAVARLREEEPA